MENLLVFLEKSPRGGPFERHAMKKRKFNYWCFLHTSIPSLWCTQKWIVGKAYTKKPHKTYYTLQNIPEYIYRCVPTNTNCNTIQFSHSKNTWMSIIAQKQLTEVFVPTYWKIQWYKTKKSLMVAHLKDMI